MIRPGGVPQARHTFHTSLSDGGPINTKNALETLGPSERGPVSSRPLVSGFPALLLAFVERRIHAVCCWAEGRPERTPRESELGSPAVWAPVPPSAP